MQILFDNIKFENMEELKNFIQKYYNFVKKIEDNLVNLDKKSEDFFVGQKFCEWANTFAYREFYRSISLIRNENTQAISDFVKLYSHLLNSCENDYNKIIDISYSIPQELSKIIE